MLAVKTASPHPVTHVAFGPDGSTFAVAQPFTGVTVCDRASGRALATYALPRASGFTGLAFLGGGSRLAVGARGVELFDAATGRRVGYHRLKWVARPLLAARGGGLVAAGGYGVRSLAAEPGESFLRAAPVRCPARTLVLALSPDGRYALGLGDESRLDLFEPGESAACAALDHPYRGHHPAHPGPAFAFAADGSRLAVCDGNDIAVYDTPRPEPPEPDEPDPLEHIDWRWEHLNEPKAFESAGGATAVAPMPRAVLSPVFRLGRPEGVRAGDRWQPPVAFTPNGRHLLIRRPRNRVQLWDVAAGATAGEWGWRLEAVTCLAVAPDGLTAAAGGRFGRVVVWDLE